MKKRLALITQGVSRVVPPILTQGDVEVVGIVESAPRGQKMGQEKSTIIHTILRRARQLMRPEASLESVARKNNLPYFLFQKEKANDFSIWLKEMRVDLVVIYSMSQLLPKDILSIPSFGVINLHPSLLPSYRGANPWFWMYYDTASQGGVTLHYVNTGEDTGDIIYQHTYDIPPGVKSPAMQDLAIGKHGVDLILKALKRIGQGSALPRLPQPAQTPTARARNIKPEEHRVLIDWAHWPIERIWHLMRGTELWLNCIDQPRGIYSGQRWVVDEYAKTKSAAQHNIPGQLKKDELGFYVQCHDGLIRVHAKFKFHPALRTIANWLFK